MTLADTGHDRLAVKTRWWPSPNAIFGLPRFRRPLGAWPGWGLSHTWTGAKIAPMRWFNNRFTQGVIRRGRLGALQPEADYAPPSSRWPAVVCPRRRAGSRGMSRILAALLG